MIPSRLDLQRICFPHVECTDHSSNHSRPLTDDPPVAGIDLGLGPRVRAVKPPYDLGRCRLDTSLGDFSTTEDGLLRLDDLIGASWPMRRLYAQLCRIAPTESSVLLVGETGSGKELVAKSLHRRSRRCHQPLVAINCAACSETLLESELFGHVKGAFTDARTDRKGLFVQADCGTLFLDEIGEMPLGMQAKLLRVLEEGALRPVGGEREVRVDVRLITATHRDLDQAVKDGKFREDLYYRINVIPLVLPPLRDRENDVHLLARHFLRHFAERFGKATPELTPAAAELLRDYNWPGNVRELRNVIERAIALTSHSKIIPQDLPDKLRTCGCATDFLPTTDPALLISLEEVERRYVRHVVRSVGGNKSLAAKVLGINRMTLNKKIRPVPYG